MNIQNEQRTKQNDKNLGMFHSRGGAKFAKWKSIDPTLGSNRFILKPCGDTVCCAIYYKVEFDNGIINPNPILLRTEKYGGDTCSPIVKENKLIQCKSVCD